MKVVPLSWSPNPRVVGSNPNHGAQGFGIATTLIERMRLGVNCFWAEMFAALYLCNVKLYIRSVIQLVSRHMKWYFGYALHKNKPPVNSKVFVLVSSLYLCEYYYIDMTNHYVNMTKIIMLISQVIVLI